MMRHRFTGWHITAILTGGFGIVFAVNILMASLAIGSFGGVVVENSYVASQKFNGWLARAERENTLDWTARVTRGGDGRLEVLTEGTPQGTVAIAELRHPLGQSDMLRWQLDPVAGGRFVSARPLPEGRWLVRLILAGGGQELRIERPVG